MYILYNNFQRYVCVCKLCFALVVTLRCKELSDWFSEDVSKSGMDCLLSCVMCFPNNLGMSQIICICMPVMTTFFFCTVTLLLSALCHNFVNGHISLNTAFKTQHSAKSAQVS